MDYWFSLFFLSIFLALITGIIWYFVWKLITSDGTEKHNNKHNNYSPVRRRRRFNGLKHVYSPEEKASLNKVRQRKRTKSANNKSQEPTSTNTKHPFVHRNCNYIPYYKPLPFEKLPPEVETGNIEYKVR